MSAGYTNLRTVSYRDTIAELIARANQTHTRATGVQVFSPGDGMAYEDSEGFLNPVSPALFDDAKSQIAEASEALVAAEAELEAAQGRIDETAVLLGQLDEQAAASAEQVAEVVKDMEADRTRLTATAAELETLKPRLGNVEGALADSEAKVEAASSAAASASTTAEAAKATADSLQAKLDAALSAQPGLLADPSFESPDAWQVYSGVQVKADSRASSGKNVLYMPPGSGSSVFAYARQPANVVKGHKYRITVRVLVESAPAQDAIRVLYRDGSTLAYKGLAAGPVLSSQELVVGQWSLVQWDWEAPESTSLGFGVQVASHTVGKAVDDFQIVDITEQADLALRVEDAKRVASEAAVKAADAATKAGQALTAASGKATIQHKTTAPQGVGIATGDVWMQWTAFPGGVVTGQWSWDGKAWQPQQLSHQVLSSVDLGKATVGELEGSFLKANSVDVNRLTVGVGGNVIPDPNFTSADLTAARIAASFGTWVHVRSGATPYVESPSSTDAVTWRFSEPVARKAIPTAPGQRWRLSVPVNPGGGSARVNVRWFDAAGVATYVAGTPYVYGTAVAEAAALWTAPPTAVSFLVEVFAPSTTSARVVQVHAGASVRSMTGAVHIEDGAITAPKVNAESVAGALGQFIKVQAQNVEVTDTLAARVLSAATSQVATSFVTDRLVVGTGTDATVLEVLGTAVVNDLNLRGTLRGRDAILDGTLDVEQLNVTEDMAATIGRFMSVETKKLIVTEAAVMQHVTAIEGIITPKITASEARIGELLAAKASIADIEGGNLTLSGSFRSAGIGHPSVVIPQAWRWSEDRTMIAVWLTADGSAPGLGATGGSASGMWVDNAAVQTATTTKIPFPLHLRGRDGGGVRVWGDLALNSGQLASLPGQDLVVWPGFNQVKQPDGSFKISQNAFKVRSSGVDVQNASGVMEMTSLGSAEYNAVGPLTLRGAASLVLQSNGNISLRKTNGDTYRQSWSGGGLLDLKMGASSGAIYTDTSSRRYKTDIQTMDPDHDWLDRRTVWYRDRRAVETAEAVEARQAAGDCAPVTAEEADLIAAASRLTPGRIAEEGGDSPQVIWQDGQVEAWDYSRDGVMLTPHVREHRDKIADLEARIAELESALL